MSSPSTTFLTVYNCFKCTSKFSEAFTVCYNGFCLVPLVPVPLFPHYCVVTLRTVVVAGDWAISLGELSLVFQG